MYIYSNVTANLLYVETEKPLDSYRVLDAHGKEVSCPKLICKQSKEAIVTTFDAQNLAQWSIDSPILYTFEAQGETVTFGHTEIRTLQDKMVLLNENPIYLRGYIRGIVAHDHPNFSGGSEYEAAVKQIKQAKKYGFNLVRFHTTIPSEDFVRAADELGILIHMETGFTFKWLYNEKNVPCGKVIESFGETLWEDTIRKFRNHPSVAVFCIGNEMRNSAHYPEVHTMVAAGRALAPTKLIMDNCGWGEYDRKSSDMFIQHMGYYLPYNNHTDMFTSDILWTCDGSAYDVPLTVCKKDGSLELRRYCQTIKPTLAHEAMHYIDVPDYAALEKKFDEFCEKVGSEYLKKYEIKKPKYFAGLRDLIAQRGLEKDMPDYFNASRTMKLACIKIYLERLRLSTKLCGYEMLQFADCFKYENKNGIVDFFDDDKGIDATWMRQFNDDLVVLADFKQERIYEEDAIEAEIFISDFLPDFGIEGRLVIELDGEVVYTGEKFVLTGGLQKLADVKVKTKATGRPRTANFAVHFISEGITVKNDWTIWLYPRIRPVTVPEMELSNKVLEAYLAEGTKKSELYFTDTLNQKLFDKLADGKTVVLNYEYQAERNTWDIPGGKELFKPCIWDRGSGLGGIIYNQEVADALGNGRYTAQNIQPLLDGSHKLNLDDFPCQVNEHTRGIDKPVRDRFRVSRDGVKGFVPEDTLRRFSHLVSFNIGDGKLIICTYNLTRLDSAVVNNFLELLIDRNEVLASDYTIAPEAFMQWLIETNKAGFRPEDRMNNSWLNDDVPVERVLFWEDLNINLAAIK